MSDMEGGVTEDGGGRMPVGSDRLDPAFRNGTLAAIGLVAAFSLGFLTRWAGVPGTWMLTDYGAVGLIVIGIVLQVKALYDLLDVDSLFLKVHGRAVRIFKIGLGLTATGVFLAVFADIVGIGGVVIR